MNICIKAADASNKFENTNTDLKRQYFIKNIKVINTIMSRVPGYCGSFGTGYPFYALDSNLEGELPFISEQIRYNNQLIESAHQLKSEWGCAKCLNTIGQLMPDLKQICKPCPRMNDGLKPRKVLNRLPDVDMWMICSDLYVDMAKEKLSKLFDVFDMRTSDVDPVQTINDVSDIADDLSNGVMPSKMLPLDVHIIEYSKFSSLISDVPFTLQEALQNEHQPYLPIHPISLRKTWQYDDVAYNFILDFMFSLTPFNWDDDLSNRLVYSRKIISNAFTNEQLCDILHSVAPDSVERRLETPRLQKVYERRMDLWKK